MKTGALPKQLDLRSLAARGVEITGTLSSDDLPRLIEAGIQVVEPGSATFRFRRDEAGRWKSAEQTAALREDEDMTLASEADAGRENPFAVLGQLKS